MIDSAPTDTFTLFAAAPLGVVPLLADELRGLGVSALRERRAGIEFEGDLDCALRVMLWTRTASRLVLRLTELSARDADDLYRSAVGYDWATVFAVERSFAIDVTASAQSAVQHTQFAALRLKDAIVDRFRADCGTRPAVDTVAPEVLLHLHLQGGTALLSLDVGGGGLHQRGYRADSALAPLKENLAAALLLRAGWPAIAAAGGAFVDPMCGSGTLLIEAALIAADIAPGLLRNRCGLTGWRGFEATRWDAVRADAATRRSAGLTRLPPIFGSDEAEIAVRQAQAGVEAAGLVGHVQLVRMPVAALRIPPEMTAQPGLLLVNPPYGQRLGDTEALAQTYASLGALLREQFADWQAAVFTGAPELARHLGLRAYRSHDFFNGAIACQLLRFRVTAEAVLTRAPRDDDEILTAARFLNDAEATGDTSGLANRIRKNLKHLQRWRAREGVTCLRCYDADLPEFALAIDLYEDSDTAARWAHVQEYAAPDSIPATLARARLRGAMRTLPGVLDIPPERVLLKIRSPQRGKAQYQRQGARGAFFTVAEGGCRFWVNLTDYLDTGLFLDHRPVRLLVQEMARGKTFLNLFCYTATASVHAARGGASTTASIDLSTTYLDWARRNFDLNAMAPEEHTLIQADCLQWLRQPSVWRERYDLILLDPPTFSNSKRMLDTLDIQRDHAALIDLAMARLAPGGTLIFSNNFRRFRLDEGLGLKYRCEDITRKSIPPDYARDTRIHHCFLIRAR
ncbi:MAG: bifunctional 23S rRNA (guanine(2069)-N(7))-methyltransferase RlmK/23S rRNA (guanine(2445)-N(2))-methyltransferase RlmL [Thiotrichales bacterium]